MGNTQSAEAPRRPPTKLTKPRTNTSTSNLLATASAPSRRGSNLELLAAPNKRASTISIVEALNDDDGASKSKASNRPQRLSLFRSKSALVEPPAQIEKHPHEYEGEMASNPLDRYSIRGSVKIDLLAEAHYGATDIRPSIRPTQSASMYRRNSQHAQLSLMVEAQDPEPELKEGSTQLRVGQGSLDEQVQYNLAPLTERSNSDPSVLIPIRRRSMLTPGIATRGNSKDDMFRQPLHSNHSSSFTSADTLGSTRKPQDFRKTLPSQNTYTQDELRQYYHDQSKPTFSPLREIATLESQRSSNVQPRTSTPCDLDYGHIGAFKLGSLRITNGDASPARSGRNLSYSDTKPATDMEGDESYFTPSKILLKPEEYQHVRFQCTPPKRENPPRIVETMVHIPSYSLGLSDFRISESPTRETNRQSPTRAYEMAQAYVAEIASSPFSFEESPPPSPQLQVTSKHTAVEDNLFEDGNKNGGSISLASPDPFFQSSSCSTDPQTSVRKLSVPTAEEKNSQQNLPRTVQGPREQALKPLMKADSGYSSKTSLRSISSRRSLNEVEAPPEVPGASALPDKSPHTPPKALYTRNSYGPSITSSTIKRIESSDTDHPPGIPSKDGSSHKSNSIGGLLGASENSHDSRILSRKELPCPPYRQAPPVPPKHSSTASSGRTGPLPPLPTKSTERNLAVAQSHPHALMIPKQPMPTRRQSLPTPMPAHISSLGLTPSWLDTSISSTKRRLQKQRPAAQARIIVQGYTEVEAANIPPVSREVEDHLEERLKTFPTLTHTYKTVHRTNSKETLATIFSMASAEQRAEESTRFSRFEGQLPDVPLSEDIESAHTSLGHIERSRFRPKVLRRSTNQDHYPGRRQSLETIGRDRRSFGDSQLQENRIASFGTVSESLGAGPYDLAVLAGAPLPRESSHDAIASYNGGNNTMSRGRIVGMDSLSATQFARERSRIRDNERHRSLLRHQSHERRSNSENRGDIPYMIPISKYMVQEAPPVPTLPGQDIQCCSLPKKAKSPPVSMTTRLTVSPNLPPQPSRPAPVLPGHVPVASAHELSPSELQKQSKPQNDQWRKPERSWHERQTALEALYEKPAAGGSIELSKPSSARASFEKQQQQHSRPPNTNLRHSFEQQTNYPSQPAQQPYFPSFQEQRRTFARQSFGASQPQPIARLARASFDSSTSNNIKSTRPLSHSQSYSQMQSLALTVDRYNGGLAYDYEPGYGIGGSAGIGNGLMAASRKGVKGSLA